MEPTRVVCSFDKTNIGYDQRAQKYVQFIEAGEKLKRYETLNIGEQQITPFEIAYENSASNQKMIGELVSGFLPYIFIAFGFIDMYPQLIYLRVKKKEELLKPYSPHLSVDGNFSLEKCSSLSYLVSRLLLLPYSDCSCR